MRVILVIVVLMGVAGCARRADVNRDVVQMRMDVLQVKMMLMHYFEVKGEEAKYPATLPELVRRVGLEYEFADRAEDGSKIVWTYTPEDRDGEYLVRCRKLSTGEEVVLLRDLEIEVRLPAE